MEYKYSKSIGVFYPMDGTYTGLPEDAIDVSQDEFWVANSREPGATLDVVKGKLKIIPPPFPSVDDLRNAANDSITAWRDAEENSGLTFEHAGREWDGGKGVRERLRPVISAMRAVGDIPGFIWTSADDEDVPMTLIDLEALAVAHDVAMVMQGNRIRLRQRQMKEAVTQMNEKELAAFVPGWGDESA